MEKKEISIAPGFSIDSDGNVYGLHGQVVKQYRNGDGYCTVNVKPSASKRIEADLETL